MLNRQQRLTKLKTRCYSFTVAQMAELVDALGSGPSSRKAVKVRIFFWASFKLLLSKWL